jgi:predicted NBD/HSP70 family sugar kinase
VYERAAAGDPHAGAVLDAQARAMALAVVSVQATLDPALVVFGGGIGSRADFIARVRSYVGELTLRHPRIEVSRLGERAGLIGAVELARAHANGQVGRDGDG